MVKKKIVKKISNKKKKPKSIQKKSKLVKKSSKVVKKKSKTIKKKPKIVKKKLKLVKKKSFVTNKNYSKKNFLERAKTGTKNLDSLIGGGFERDSNNLIVGSSGSGKTIFGVQFLAQGIREGESCLYISFEERKDAFYKNLKGVGIDLAKFESQKKFYFLEYTPQKVKAMLDEGGGAIETLVLTKNIKRIVIDSVSSFTLLFEKELSKKEAALALFTLLKSWNCTTLLISDEDSIDETESSKVIDQEVDSIIKIYFSRGGKVRQRYLEILKMRGTNHSLFVHPFKITDNGLTVSKSHVSIKK